MNAAKGSVRVRAVQGPAQTPRRDLIDAGVQCSERAATHDLVEVHQLADGLLALADTTEQALDMLDEYEGFAGGNGGAP